MKNEKLQFVRRMAAICYNKSMKQILLSSSGFGYPPAEGRCEAGATRGAEPHVIDLYRSLGGGLAYD